MGKRYVIERNQMAWKWGLGLPQYQGKYHAPASTTHCLFDGIRTMAGRRNFRTTVQPVFSVRRRVDLASEASEGAVAYEASLCRPERLDGFRVLLGGFPSARLGAEWPGRLWGPEQGAEDQRWRLPAQES